MKIIKAKTIEPVLDVDNSLLRFAYCGFGINKKEICNTLSDKPQALSFDKITIFFEERGEGVK